MAAKPLFDASAVHEARILDLIPVVPDAIVTKALIDTGGVKQILFAMDAGQEISQHKAPYVATVHVLDGDLEFEVEGKARGMGAGAWLVMPPDAPHRLRATEACRFLLTLVKGGEQVVQVGTGGARAPVGRA